jgi:hypothetical protein
MECIARRLPKCASRSYPLYFDIDNAKLLRKGLTELSATNHTSSETPSFLSLPSAQAEEGKYVSTKKSTSDILDLSLHG